MSARGLTMAELLFVMAIVAVLATVALTSYTKVQRRAEGTVCMTKMKKLYTALRGYMNDNKSWPQEPDDDSLEDAVVWDWWYDEMKPYGVEREDWFCPAEWRAFNKIRRKEGREQVEEKELGRHPDMKDPSYIPTPFGPGELEPVLSGTPWLIERYPMHEDAHFLMLPNGKIIRQQSLLKHNRVRSMQ